LINAFREVNNAKIESLLEFTSSKKKFKNYKTYYLMFDYLISNKLNIHLASYGEDGEMNREVRIGKKLNKKEIEVIYEYILKWFQEDYEKEAEK